MKLNRKKGTFIIATVLLIAFNTCFVAAAPPAYKEDTGHGYFYATSPADVTRLNQYCSSTPVSGTRVTTWPATTSATQIWEHYFCTDSNGIVHYDRIALVPELNFRLVTGHYYDGVSVNGYRSYINSEVNLYPIAQNNYMDFSIAITYSGGDIIEGNKHFSRCTLSLDANSQHKGTVYITATSTGTGDSQNLGRKCVWSYGNTGLVNQYWYESDSITWVAE